MSAGAEVPRALQPADHAPLLALNNAHAIELSWLQPDAFSALLEQAWHVRTLGAGDALLIALDQQARYDNANFAWFAARHPRFVYIDRIVVAATARGRGYAGTLYDALLVDARVNDHHVVCCEINLDPANPASLAFHLRHGFAQVGEALLTNGKRVGYFELPLAH